MFSNLEIFLDKFMGNLKEAGVDVSGLSMDHVGYKTNSLKEYEQIMPRMKKTGKLVKENTVRDRKVAFFKLDHPIIYKQYTIPAAELIAPKEGETVRFGWEHAELVIPESFESFMAKYPKLTWDTSVMNSDLFSMVKLKLGDNMQAKFHLMPVLEIIEKEK